MSQYINFPKMDIVIQGLEAVEIPKMYKMTQIYDSNKIDDPGAYIRKMMAEYQGVDKDSFKGKRIAVTVGSRGIPFLPDMVKAILDTLKEWGAEPFIVPSMGSHGGATAEGQLEVLEGLGITEETMEVPIISCMDVVVCGTLSNGAPVYVDKVAMEADGIVLFNKVKPHTEFRGPHESGLFKMVAIGLGNHIGASMFHSLGYMNIPRLLPELGQVFLDNAKFAFGIGVVQNAYDDICTIEMCDKSNALAVDAKLQQEAKEKIPNFKFDNIDLLIIDEIGKNMSGSGMDPNVVGRNMSETFRGLPGLPTIRYIFVRSITLESHHSGVGIALANITTRRCLNSIDWDATWTNVVTATVLGSGGSIPMYRENDREAIVTAIKCCSGIDFKNARIVRIKNTLETGHIEVSAPLYEELKNHPEIKYVEGPYDMEFDDEGFIVDRI